MQKVEEIAKSQPVTPTAKLPVSVIVAARNEEKNLPRCLEALRNVGEVYVIDSGSTDATPEIARAFGVKLVQFHYQGGWPKKRQWAIENLPLEFDWIFLVDADEAPSSIRSKFIRSPQKPAPLRPVLLTPCLKVSSRRIWLHPSLFTTLAALIRSPSLDRKSVV